jgi:hypothetical protein
MGKCRRVKKYFLESLYGDLDMKKKESLDKHLDTCRKCSEEYAGMARTLKTMSAKSSHDPGPEFWQGYWGRLEQRMKREGIFETRSIQPESRKSPRTRWGFFPRLAVGAAGAAAILMFGILIGRQFFSRPQAVVQQVPGAEATVFPASAEQDLGLRTSQYLERSKVVILALVNFDPKVEDVYGINLPRQKKASEELVKEAAVLRSDLKKSNNRQLERLVSDLEMILIQIANLESGHDLAAVDVIKAGVEHGDVLFKINLSEMRRTKDTRQDSTRSPENTKKI